MLLALVAIANAAHLPSHRKMLTLNSQNAVQQNRYYRGNMPYDNGSAQLAANNRAIVNTQLAIESAVNSGADPGVTRAAANYGNAQAYQATQTRRCGYYGNRWWPC